MYDDLDDMKKPNLLTTSTMEELAKVHTLFPFTEPLSNLEAQKQQHKYGKNILAVSKPVLWYIILLYAVIQPFNVILVLLAVISGVTGDLITTGIMCVMITASSGLKFIQEFKSSVALEALKKMVENYVTVIRLYDPPTYRDPNFEDVRLLDAGCAVEVDIFIEDVVPGDLIRIRAGDLIPGDVKILHAKDLFVSEAALTGESIPLEKYALPDCKEKVEVVDRRDMCFMGSSVVSGTATAIVVKIGSDTMFGEMAEKLAGSAPRNAFQTGIRQVSYLFFGLMVVMLPLVTILSGVIQKDWGQAFLFAIGVAVGLTPEMLPMIVNANLAKGAISMAKKKTIVKKLDSIINLGSMDVLCTDKTGTLTQNKVVLVKYVDLNGIDCSTLLKMAYLNSHFQTGLRNLIDEAILTYYHTLPLKETLQYTKIDEIPFDFVRRRMSVILKHEESHILVSKGALEEMIDICVAYKDSTRIVPFTQDLKLKAIEAGNQLNEEGLRVVAVGFKETLLTQSFSVADESNMVFCGLIGFLDPPKESTLPAIKELIELGVQVKVLTGDSAVVCVKVCKQIELPIMGIVTTKDLLGLTDDQVGEIAARTTIFAKLQPLQKAQVVRALKGRGHTVGFLGDGINDAPALKESDVGISVDDGVEVAKESADIILLENDLMVLVDGVLEGRRTYANTIKYIKLAISSNFGNVFSVLIASALLPFLPMLTIHLVLQNLLYDFSQLVIPWDNVDSDYLKEPKKFNVKSIISFMLFIGPISSIFDVLTFGFCWWKYNCATTNCETEFQTSWFLEGLITQTLIVHMLRTDKIPFFQSISSKSLIVSSMAATAVGTLIATTKLSKYFHMATPRLIYYPYLIFAVLSYCLCSQIAKFLYVKKFKSWL